MVDSGGNRLGGKVAWVTGAGSGIGKAVALSLSGQGARLVLSDIDRAAAQETADLCGLTSVVLAHDVSQEAAWESGAAAVADHCGHLDILVNNAGIMVARPFANAPVEILRKQQKINVEGVYIGMQVVLPMMRRAIDKGAVSASIINIASVYGMVAGAQFAAYSATKGAVRSLSRAVAAELASANIRVNCVLPGPVMTNLSADWDPPTDASGALIPPDQALAAWAALIPMGRLGQANEIAPLVAFLASDDARFITGAEFVADGGYTAI